MPTWRKRQTHQVESLAVDKTMRDRGPPSVPARRASTQTGKAPRLKPEGTVRSTRTSRTGHALLAESADAAVSNTAAAQASGIVARRAQHFMPS